MRITDWIHRLKSGKTQPVKPARGRKAGAVARRKAANGTTKPHHSREQYDSESITRYGDPFD